MTTAKKILLHEKAIKLLHINEQLNEIIIISDEELNSDALFLEFQRAKIEKRKRLVKKALTVNEKQYKIVLKQLNNE
jgi:hypothetical protein